MRGLLLPVLIAGYSVDTDQCDGIRSAIGSFAAMQEQKYKSGDVGKTVTYLPAGGIGDQASGFLGAVVIAMITDRYLQIPRHSFWYTALVPKFESRRPETGEPDTGGDEAVPRWICDGEREMDLDQFLSKHRWWSRNDTAVTNLYCTTHQLGFMRRRGGVRRYLDAYHERVRVGNVGTELFHMWVATRLRHRQSPADPILLPCAFRSLFTAAERAIDAAKIAAPWIEKPPFIVNIHVRASRYLAKDSYGDNNDNVFSCHPPVYKASDFTDIWNTAYVVEAAIAGNRSSEVRWLLTSDSESLKDSAAKVFPQKIVTSTIIPRHNDFKVQQYKCGDTKESSKSSSSSSRKKVHNALSSSSKKSGDEGLRRRRRKLLEDQNFTVEEETIGELLLLSQADAIITGKSRFAKTAIMLCDMCQKVVYYMPCTNDNCMPVTTEAIAALQTPPGWTTPPTDIFQDKVTYAVMDLPDSYGDQRLIGQHVAIDKIDPAGHLAGWVF